MIDRLPPSAHPAVAQPAGPRAQPTASFDKWIRPADRDSSPDAGGENVRTNASSDVSADIPRSDAVQAQEIGEVVFSFHARGETGAVEVFSVPWRLGANAALSHLSRAAYEAAIVLNARPASESVDQTLSPAPASLSAPVASPRTSTLMPLPGALIASSASLAPGAPVASGSAVEPGSTTSTAIAEPWLARLLRLLDQQGHDPVLWIRDYRLDDAASQSVVAEVRSMVERQGWKLERIMVNGREMWHSPLVLDSMGKP